MKKKINIGIIGKNFGHKVTYKVIKKIKSFNTIAFCFKSNSYLKNNKKITIYKDWKKLLNNKNLNAIVIASPPETHFKIIKEAIKKKIHIFCEKPVTKSLKEINQICNMIKKKNIIHSVNFQFPNIGAFIFLKKKILNNIKIKKINIEWFIKIPRHKRSTWKDLHKKGGGIFYNYLCHNIYYLNELFGELLIEKSIKKPRKNPKSLIIKFRNIKDNFIININFKILSVSSKKKPNHKIQILSNKGIYLLLSKTESVKDKFYLKKSNKIIYKPKIDNEDFRISPMLKNLRNFQKSIINKKIAKPNFFDAQKVHSVINKLSS